MDIRAQPPPRNQHLLTWVRQPGQRNYDEIKRCIHEHIELDRAYWGDDVCAEWIEMAVKLSFPWFVCNSWNHLSQTNVQLLYDMSLRGMHMSNIHQLLRNGLVECWSSSFWDDSTKVNDFFMRRNQAKHAKFIKRFVREYLSQREPWGDMTCAPFMNVLTSLVENERDALLKWLYDRTPCMRSLTFMQLLIVHQRIDLIQWIADTTDCRFPWRMSHWYTLFVAVHPYHISNSLDRHYRSRIKHRMLLQLLRMFDRQCSAPTTESDANGISWTALLTHSEDHHCLLNFLAISHAGDVLLQFAMERAAGEIVGEGADASMAYAVVECEVVSQEGWTPLANAARWGVVSTVRWLLEHNAAIDFSSYTYNSMLSHNLLSLACYNSRDGVLDAILENKRCAPHLYTWLEAGYGDTLAGMCSPWISQSGRVSKLSTLVRRIPRAVYMKNYWLTVYNQHCSVPPTEDPLLDSLLRIPGKITAAGTIFNLLIRACDSAAGIRHMVSFLRTNGLRDYAPLYSLLLPHGSVTSEAILDEITRQNDFDASMHRATDEMKKAIVFSWCMRITSRPAVLEGLHNNVKQWCQTMRERWQWDLGFLPSDAVHGVLRLRGIDQRSIYELLRYGFPPIIGTFMESNAMSGRHMRTERVYRRLGHYFILLRQFVRRRKQRWCTGTHRARRQLHFQLRCYPPQAKPGKALLMRGSHAFNTMLQKLGAQGQALQATALVRVSLPHCHATHCHAEWRTFDCADSRLVEWRALLNAVDKNSTLLLYVVPKGEAVTCHLTGAHSTSDPIAASGVHVAASAVTFITDVAVSPQQTTRWHRLRALRGPGRDEENDDHIETNNVLQRMRDERNMYRRFLAQTSPPGRWWPVRAWTIRAHQVPALAHRLLMGLGPRRAVGYPYEIGMAALTLNCVGQPQTYHLF